MRYLTQKEKKGASEEFKVSTSFKLIYKREKFDGASQKREYVSWNGYVLRAVHNNCVDAEIW